MVFNNANPIDVGEAVAKLKEDCPGLFLEPDETVHMAFKTTRDKYFFTSHRILVRDKHGITGKRTEYKSCPYHSIKVTSKGSLPLYCIWARAKAAARRGTVLCWDTNSTPKTSPHRNRMLSTLI